MEFFLLFLVCVSGDVVHNLKIPWILNEWMSYFTEITTDWIFRQQK